MGSDGPPAQRKMYVRTRDGVRGDVEMFCGFRSQHRKRDPEVPDGLNKLSGTENGLKSTMQASFAAESDRPPCVSYRKPLNGETVAIGTFLGGPRNTSICT